MLLSAIPSTEMIFLLQRFIIQNLHIQISKFCTGVTEAEKGKEKKKASACQVAEDKIGSGKFGFASY